jgi:hypothetical protein
MTEGVPTESLQALFSDLDFLGSAMDNLKPCFLTRTYEDKDSWIGAAKRWWHKERQEVVGLQYMRSICLNAAQNYCQYHNNRFFGDTLTRKIIAARKGLERIAKTYESIGKVTAANDIRNGPIVTLDNILPRDCLVREGFVNVVISPEVIKSPDENRLRDDVDEVDLS